MISKIIFIAPLLLNLSLPMDSLAQISVLTTFIILFCSFNPSKTTRKRILIFSLSTVIVLFGLNKLLIKSGFKEYAQIYHHLGSGYDVSPTILNEIKSDFLADMPEKSWCPTANPGCWLNATPPQRPWSFHFTLQNPNGDYRIVRNLDYESVRDLKRQMMFSRFGKDGETSYRSWPLKHNSGYIKRENIPYIIKLVPFGEIAGKRICWEGLLFVNEVRMSAAGCKEFTRQDVVIGFSGVNRPLKLSVSLSITEIGILLAKFLLSVSYILIFFKALDFTGFKKSPYLLFISMFFVFSSLKFIKLETPVFDGGDDGLTHSGFGTFIIEELVNGRVLNALRGGEDIFYFMPGLRYLWPVNLTLFGTTAYFFMFFAFMIPFFVYQITNRLYSSRDAKFIFVFSVLYTWSFRTFIVKGFPEAISYAGITLGLALLIKNIPRLESYRQVFFSYLLITLSCFLRPNLILSSFLICVIFLITNYKNLMFLISALIGSLPVLFCLVHNYYFGHKFVLLTSSATMDVNLFCKPSDYINFLQALLSFSFDPAHKAWLQLKGIFHTPLVALIYLLPFIKLVTRKVSLKEKVILFAFLGLFATHFFWHPAGRYSWLTLLLAIIFTWDLIMTLSWRLIYYSSVQKYYFPLVEDYNLIKILRANVRSLKGLNAFKFFYRCFIFPWKELISAIPQNKIVCDIGCGSGFFLYSISLNRSDVKLMGIEISKGLIDAARNLFGSRPSVPYLELYDGVNFPLATKDSDVFILNDVFHHIPLVAREKFVKNLSSHLNSDKILILKDMDASDRFWVLFNKIHDCIFSREWPREISLDDAKTLLQANGFKISQVQKIRKFVYSHFMIIAIKK